MPEQSETTTAVKPGTWTTSEGVTGVLKQSIHKSLRSFVFYAALFVEHALRGGVDEAGGARRGPAQAHGRENSDSVLTPYSKLAIDRAMKPELAMRHLQTRMFSERRRSAFNFDPGRSFKCPPAKLRAMCSAGAKIQSVLTNERQ